MEAQDFSRGLSYHISKTPRLVCFPLSKSPNLIPRKVLDKKSKSKTSIRQKVETKSQIQQKPKSKPKPSTVRGCSSKTTNTVSSFKFTIFKLNFFSLSDNKKETED